MKFVIFVLESTVFSGKTPAFFGLGAQLPGLILNPRLVWGHILTFIIEWSLGPKIFGKPTPQ